MKKQVFVSIFASLLFLGNTQAQTNKLAQKVPHSFQLPAGVESTDYLAKTVVFKLSPKYRAIGNLNTIQHPALQNVLNYLGVDKIGRKFPHHQAPERMYNNLGQKFADLSLIYELKYTNSISIEDAINQLLSVGVLEYAEPHYIFKLFDYEPSDVRADSVTGQQRNAFKRIRAYKAWDIALGGSQGDTNVVVGIVDSGTDLDHPDLAANFKKNYADPINGADDDGDGYIDNFNGWDLGGADYNNVVGDNDANCTGANNNHGSHVSGCASQVSDNGTTGGAGIGFKCKLLAVKCAADNDTRGPGGVGYIIAGYEGITYAADHGADVINCSWGGSGGGSFGQDIIDYATINQDALVVAAAGNDGINVAYFPASYNYVISVAATNSTSDQKASFSNYDYSVDISAPGNGIDATVYNNTYTSMSGTSMASPITAGAAALVKSKFPTYTALQVGQRLKATTDNHYVAGPNVTSPVNTGSALQNKLGTGRLNAFRALIDPLSSSVVFTDQVVTDNNDDAFIVNDTISISGLFINYLAPTTNLTAVTSVVAGGTYVTMIDDNTTLGAIQTLDTANNISDPFKYKINAGTPLNSVITFKVTLTDGSYTDSYFINVTVNVDYINITINDVGTTITSKGKIGYNQDGQLEGLGFTYLGANLLYEGGLMIGTSTTQVSDAVRGITGNTADQDLQSVQNVYRVIPNVKSEFDVAGIFNDVPASPTQNLLVSHNAYAWSTPGNRKYVIVEYKIKNNGSAALNNLFAGICADWDVDNYANNKSDYASTPKMGYTWCTDANGKYAGIKLLTNSAPPVFYAIDNVAGGGGGIDINDAGDYFNTPDKYTSLSTNRLQGGNTVATGNDVLNVMSAGPYSINAGDSVTVAFALIAGDNLTDLTESADSAQVHYDAPPIPVGISQISDDGAIKVIAFPNPADNNLSFSINNSEQAEDYDITIYNAIGQEVMKMEAVKVMSGLSSITIDVTTLNEGMYYYRLENKGKDKGKVRHLVGTVIVTHSSNSPDHR